MDADWLADGSDNMMDASGGSGATRLLSPHELSPDAPAPSLAALIAAVGAYLPDFCEARLSRAFRYAQKAHGPQLRASGEPYWHHPASVALSLTEVRMDETTIIAGLLHDVVEDTDQTLADIEERFGPHVAALVDGVTKLTRLSRSEETAEARKLRRQAETLQKFILASIGDLRVLMVKLADRMHNMRTLYHVKSSAKREVKSRETLDIYAPLARQVGLYPVAQELEDLAFRHIAPASYAAIRHRLSELEGGKRDAIERLRGQIHDVVEAAGLDARIKGRRKQPYSIWRKIERKTISFNDVADVFAFRVILADPAQCYEALGALHRRWPCVPERFRDFISVPKPNGYRSLHTTLRAHANAKLELQIRTEDMHDIAERGVAAHWQYKNASYGLDAEAARASGIDPAARLGELADLVKDGADPEDFIRHAKLQMYREHLFVFTPKGRIIILPKGARPLDFAYALHTAIGDSAISVRINGEQRPMSTELRNGDVVEIIRTSDDVQPQGREAIATTGRALSRIARLVRQTEQASWISSGRTQLTRSVALANLNDLTVDWDKVAARNGLSGRQALFELVGKGALNPAHALQRALPSFASDAPLISEQSSVFDGPASGFVAGSDLKAGVALRFARCCLPVPGDRIAAVRSDGGLEIHSIDCTCLEPYYQRANAWVDVGWADLAEGTLALSRIRVAAINQRGVLAELCVAIAAAEANIRGIRTDEKSPDFIDILFEVEIVDNIHRARVITALRALSVTDSAERDYDESCSEDA